MSPTDGAGQQLAYNPPKDKRLEPLLKPPELLHLLQRFRDAATLPARRSAFIDAVRWTRHDKGASAELTRLVQVLDILKSDAELRAGVQQSLGKLLSEIDSLALFAEVGLPSVHPFTTEIVRRLIGRLLPSARRDSDAAKLLSDLYARESYVKRFTAQPLELFQRTAAVLTPQDDPGFWERQLHDLHEAMRLLAARISGLGLAPEMRDRNGTHGISRSPFYELVRKTDDFISGIGTPETTSCLDAWRQDVARCRQEMEEVYGHMESEGIGVELVFDLKTIKPACSVWSR